MLKRMLGLSMVMLMLASAVPALAEYAAADIDNDPLGWEELRMWSEECLRRAMAEPPLSRSAETGDGYEWVFSFATLYLTTPDLTDETAVKAIEITGGELEAPHATRVGMTLDELLDSYYYENAELLGSETAAVLYLIGTERGLGYGCVRREGQQVRLVEYAACELAENGAEGYGNAGVTYVIEDGLVAAIRVYGLDARMSEDELLARDAEMERLMNEDSYSQAKTSYNGMELEEFGAEDLVFSGIDFQSAEDMRALGGVRSESWISNGDGGYIHLVTYEDCEATWLCDEEKGNPRLEMLTILSGGMEGPRHTRIGDTMVSVRNRFRHSGGQLTDGTNVEPLYGDPSTVPYGTAEYGMDGVNVMRYACRMENGQTAVLMFTFEEYLLSEIMIGVTE